LRKTHEPNKEKQNQKKKQDETKKQKTRNQKRAERNNISTSTAVFFRRKAKINRLMRECISSSYFFIIFPVFFLFSFFFSFLLFFTRTQIEVLVGRRSKKSKCASVGIRRNGTRQFEHSNFFKKLFCQNALKETILKSDFSSFSSFSLFLFFSFFCKPWIQSLRSIAPFDLLLSRQIALQFPHSQSISKTKQDSFAAQPKANLQKNKSFQK
jgi:hypothetical protein